MHEVFADVLTLPGLIPMLLACLVGGIVFGFSGFGGALIFLPLSMAFIPPQFAVAAFALANIGPVLTVFPKARRHCDIARTVYMAVPAVFGMFAGVLILKSSPPLLLQWAISLLVLVTLIALILGWRRKVGESRGTLAGIGAASGVMGGATGLLGPVVILFNLSGTASAATMRANTLVFLSVIGLILIPVMYFQGIMTPQSFWFGCLLLPIYMIGNLFGQAMFTPKFEHLYRKVSYAVIALAVLVGLPIWG